MAMATTTYDMEAMIYGYHVYATVWDAQIGEELYCTRETGNICDPYAVRTVWTLQLCLISACAQ